MSAFQFRPDESVRHAVHRIARHEIETMLAELKVGPRGRTAVHEARKSSKKLRALVRLVRDGIGEKTYRSENTTLRDAVRPLSPVRDAEALLHILDVITEHFAGEVRARMFDHLRKTLQTRLRAIRAAPSTRAAMRRSAALVARVRSHLAKVAIRDGGWQALGPGLHRIYARARAAKRQVDDDPNVEHLHEWRKRSKDLRYALELLEPTWPPVVKAFADEGHALTDRLGDDQDLARLEQVIHAEPASCGTPEDRAALLGLIDVRRDELQAEARSLGERIYREKPRAFITRHRGYWRGWREQRNA